MSSEMEEYYDKHIKPLETPEFIEWFNGWFFNWPRVLSHETMMASDIKDVYLSERRFCLIGWLAGRNELKLPLD